MPVPREILAVERPSSTVVKRSGNKYVVIKRTSKRVGKRTVPVDIGRVGEIVDGRFIERIMPEKKDRTVDIKDYGEVTLCNKIGHDLLDELARVWDIADAKRLYVIALLRASYGDIKNRDLMMQYQTSFASEIIPGIHLSEDAVSSFLEQIGQEYSKICAYMRNRIKAFGGEKMVVDGTLKDYNSGNGYMSEFSRKARTKGSKDMSILYAFDPENKEPIAAKPYPGNMLDQTTIENFISENKINRGMMLLDKGFYSKALFENVDKIEGLSYLVPLKQNSKLIKNYGMDDPTEHLKGYRDDAILYKKAKMTNGKYLYAFRSPKMACQQEVAYVMKAGENEEFDSKKYTDKKSSFGLIVFKSKSNLEPLLVYQAYAQRWSVEIMFNLYKNIIDRDTVNVHTDYRVYATELINFLSVVITTRVKNEFMKKELNKKYSYKQIFKMLSKYKKVRLSEGGAWENVTLLKYIKEITDLLGV